MARTLIAYFSRADENYFGGAMRYVKVGNTEIVCNLMKELIDADSFKIEMKNPYSPVYMTCIEEAKKDLRAGTRPELVALPESIDGYDTVVLAYPNYWGTMPMAVFTFLEAFDFSGKTILPLCTNEGSGMGGSERDISEKGPVHHRQPGRKFQELCTEVAVRERIDVTMDAREIIREMYRKYWRYMIEKDADGLRSLMAKDYTLMHMTGVKQPAEVFMRGLLDGTFNYYSAEHDDIEVEVDGDRATMIGKSRVSAAVYGGRRSTWRLQGDFTLRKERGTWRFTSSRASTY